MALLAALRLVTGTGSAIPADGTVALLAVLRLVTGTGYRLGQSGGRHRVALLRQATGTIWWATLPPAGASGIESREGGGGFRAGPRPHPCGSVLFPRFPSFLPRNEAPAPARLGGEDEDCQRLLAALDAGGFPRVLTETREWSKGKVPSPDGQRPLLATATSRRASWLQARLGLAAERGDLMRPPPRRCFTMRTASMRRQWATKRARNRLLTRRIRSRSPMRCIAARYPMKIFRNALRGRK
jgi:hypothetical protein